MCSSAEMLASTSIDFSKIRNRAQRSAELEWRNHSCRILSAPSLARHRYDICRRRVHDPLDHAGQPRECVLLFAQVIVSVIDALDPDDLMAQASFGNVAADTRAHHQRL